MSQLTELLAERLETEPRRPSDSDLGGGGAACQGDRHTPVAVISGTPAGSLPRRDTAWGMSQENVESLARPPVHLADPEPSRIVLLVQGLAATGVVAFISTFGAAMANEGCKSDGSFTPDDPSARPSAFCKASHLPGFPNTLTSALILGVLFLLPALVVIGGGATAVATRRRYPLYYPFAAAVVLAILGYISIPFCHVGYKAF